MKDRIFSPPGHENVIKKIGFFSESLSYHPLLLQNPCSEKRRGQ
ncbi:Uncharacterized protein dnm_030840 [Desulfonema magnum]|uniref:Uncharacterized protein n=1 Tax=Desulfonema magnum TaxID=45655 RepID=A0A975GMT5_9BACT|nr:Uncharacterized protein dnm_030840 [Desulfonema magnum]